MRIVLVCLIFLLSSVLLLGQDSLSAVQKNTIVKIDFKTPIWWLIHPYSKNMFALSVERTMLKYQSIQLTGYFNDYTYTYASTYVVTPSSVISSPSGTTMTKAIQIYPQYRFYVAFKHKFYVGTYMKYSYMHQQKENTYVNINPRTEELNFIQQDLGIGGLIGYQFFIKKRISIDLSLGLGITKHISTKIINISPDILYFNDITTKQPFFSEGFTAINLGWRFIQK